MTTRGDLHVVAVGGAGDMGRHAVRAVARLEAVGRISIADIDVDRAERLAAELDGVARAVRVDATDARALVAAFADADVVLNTMGPFARFGRPILEAAIEAGCDYLDIDDDWESTLEALELAERARDRGVKAVVGLGASPGVTNLLAAEAARRLDTIEDLLTGWKLSATRVEHESGDAPRSGPSAAIEHWLLQCSGRVRVWEAGRYRDQQPLQELVVDYPGLGPQRTFTVGHPEAITLPRAIAGVVRSVNVMSGPRWLFDGVREVADAVDHGHISLTDGARQLERLEPPPGAETEPRDPLPRLWSLARGERDGSPAVVSAHLRAWPPHRMGGMTGYPLAVGVELLAEGLVKGPGVLAPEQAIDPADFLDRFARMIEPPDLAADELLVLREARG